MYFYDVGRQRTLEILESVLELKKLQKKQPNIKAEKRILCLILLNTNKFRTHQLLADYLGVCRQRLVAWLTAYRKSGIDGILLKTSRNTPSKIITSEIH